MPTYRVSLGVDNETGAALRAGLARLGTLPDGEVLDDDEGLALRLDQSQSSDAALARAHTIVRGALDGTGIEPDVVRLSPDPGDWTE